MEEAPEILLIGNYPPDRQISMARYAELLRDGLRGRGLRVELLCPRRRLNPFADSRRGLAKWLGYLDKFLLFPWRLRRCLAKRAGAPPLVHICDHSNAPYLFVLPRGGRGTPHLVTCHDLIAVRSALGEIPERRTRLSGRLLQRAILAGLRRAAFRVCVSQQTQRELLRLGGPPEERTAVVPNALNHPYRPLEAGAAQALLAGERALDGVRLADGAVGPFLLHVGSGVWYKNRPGLLAIYGELRRLRGEAPPLLLVGPPLSAEERARLAAEGLERWVHRVEQLAPQTLGALYSLADGLIFPSLAEGFGWPPLEAMACGCPLAVSDRAPMSEVAGEAALYFDPAAPAEAAAVVARLLDEEEPVRAARVARGLERVARFSRERLLDEYEAIYRRLRDGV